MSRAKNILEGFTRYCSGPYSKTMVDILAELEQLNDDLWHGRDRSILLERTAAAQIALGALRGQILTGDVEVEP